MKLYKGNVIFSKNIGELTTIKNGYIAVNDNGLVEDVYSLLPENLINVPVVDYGDKIIIPGFVDTHLHAAQYVNRGLGYDLLFPDWMSEYTQQAEKQYNEKIFAHKLNQKLINNLWECGITRSVIMCGIGNESTEDLFEQYKTSGLSAYIGKMNCDLNISGEPVENYKDSTEQTLELVKKYGHSHDLVKYIISPEFIPNCTTELMEYLGKLSEDYDIPVQSHLSEGDFDVEIVKNRYPDDADYSSVYHKFGLFGQRMTVMAHAICCVENEIELMRKNKVLVAYCPNAVLNISSVKFLEIRRYLNAGVHVGLGSDISGGHTLDMFKSIISTIQISKIVFASNPNLKPISLIEAFYLATKGGGYVFSNAGSFEKGFAFDALVIDDSTLFDYTEKTLEQRLERLIYCGDSRNISYRYCNGNFIDKPFNI